MWALIVLVGIVTAPIPSALTGAVCVKRPGALGAHSDVSSPEEKRVIEAAKLYVWASGSVRGILNWPRSTVNERKRAVGRTARVCGWALG